MRGYIQWEQNQSCTTCVSKLCFPNIMHLPLHYEKLVSVRKVSETGVVHVWLYTVSSYWNIHEFTCSLVHNMTKPCVCHIIEMLSILMYIRYAYMYMYVFFDAMHGVASYLTRVVLLLQAGFNVYHNVHVQPSWHMIFTTRTCII